MSAEGDAGASGSGGDEGGISVPKAEFIDDVAQFLEGKDVDKVLAQLQENVRSYRMLEQDMMQRRARLQSKLPELKRSLEIIKQLIERQKSGEDMITDFPLAEGVFAKAKIAGATTVNLHLGADVMLEYPLAEALALLEENESNCRANLKTNEDNLAFIKDSLTTTEVSIARIYNHDVERRRKVKEAGGSS